MQLRDAYRQLPNLDEFKSESLLEASEATPGIYVLQDVAGDVVYVGQSGDVRRRLAQHRAEGKKAFRHASFYPIDDLAARLRIEGALTLLLHPEYNDAVLLGLRNPISGGRRVWEWDRQRVYRRPSRKRGAGRPGRGA